MGEAAVIWGRLTEAFWLNCQLFGLTLLFALPLGLVVSFGSMSRLAPLRGAFKTFVWIIRGTPLMLQILVIYLGPGLMGFASPWPSGGSGRLVAAVVAFAINYAYELYEACWRAKEGYWQKDGWPVLVHRAMECDFSWSNSAKSYEGLYNEVVNLW